jgi:Fe2+ transport system protein FeoA
MNDYEIIAITVPSETRRRLATLGFPHDLDIKEVARFLIEQGLTVLERRERAAAS